MKTADLKTKKFKVGEAVAWKWLGREVLGKVKSVHLKPYSCTIKGKTIKRNGSAENPAYVVESEAGNAALKLHSELHAHKKTSAKAKSAAPKMFK